MSPNKLLYKGKQDNNWVVGYPVIKNNKVFIFDKETYELIPIDENTLSKKIDDKYFENDVFELYGYHWVIHYEEAMSAYQLTRVDPQINFTYYLPLLKIEEAKYLGNIIDSPELI